ncbi:MAG TPA: SMC-Scp complex subunit ScpB [Steroidobacteraceae bacterium]|jgi:segregation and condensation protein B
MNETYIKNVVEAALLAAGKSLQPLELAQLFDENARPSVEEIRAALETLTKELEGRAIEVKETGGGFRIQVRREFANEISRLWPERPAKYSRAMLETLALIAYRQPITRAEIESVRGVAVNPNILKTMMERNWIRVVGHRDVPGRPELLGTTREFLEYFGLRSLDELPPLAQLKAMGELNLQLELPEAQVAGAEGTAEVAGNGEAEGAATAVVVAETAADQSVGAEASAAADVDVDAAVTSGSDAVAVGEATAVAAAANLELPPAVDESDELGALGSEEGDEDVEADAEDVLTDTSIESSVDSKVDADEDQNEDDELSADGHNSRELVAAPPDHDD